MDIAALSSSMASSNLMNQVSTQVLAMNMDDAEELSAGMQKVLEMSVNPELGGNIDVSL